MSADTNVVPFPTRDQAMSERVDRIEDTLTELCERIERLLGIDPPKEPKPFRVVA